MRNYLLNNEPTHPATVLLYLGRQNWWGPILSHQVQSLKAAALRDEFPMEAFLRDATAAVGSPYRRHPLRVSLKLQHGLL